MKMLESLHVCLMQLSFY